ncbi:unnamed protein product [Coffea canephora]|uniref:DH200=94 genomic scaffold, scaffold_2201 n=1 Tax=Coffea canephora TaxID=49390 RepID=A0A068VK48_COFCA|nr:unnamed protein product [Coffea canephora]
MSCILFSFIILHAPRTPFPSILGFLHFMLVIGFICLRVPLNMGNTCLLCFSSLSLISFIYVIYFLLFI